jgi:type I restriction enzyme M protein
MASEMNTVIKKITPYLQRRGYSLDDNLFFGERAENEQERVGFVDILVKRTSRATRALFLVEAKRDTARLSASHRQQALRYGTVLEVPFVVTTNGAEFELHNVVTGRKLKVNGSVIGKIPRYTHLDNVLAQFRSNPFLDNITLTDDRSLPYRAGLNLPELNALLRRCHNTIRDVEKDEENIFADLSKLLFLKLLEEKEDRGELNFELPYSYRFHELAQRGKEPDQVKDAILSMMQQVVHLPEYGDVLVPVLHMQKAITYYKVVSELARVNFSDSLLDVRGSAFEYFVKTSLQGRKLGQFFTPRPLVRFMLSLIPLEQVIPDLLDPDCDRRVIDPACGSGGFLLVGMNNLLQKVEQERGKTYSDERVDHLKKRIKKDVFWGTDANQRIASAAKMNMILAGDGFANIRCGDSLTNQIDFLSVGKGHKPTADFIVTNPPFGMSEASSLSPEDFARYALRVTKAQGLFLQKMIGVSKSKPQARILTVIDDGVLNTGAMVHVRKHVIGQCHLDAVISMPEVTFRPNKINVRSSLLLLTKKQDEDDVQDYPIRMIEMNQMGYGSMGEEDTAVNIDDIISLVKARWGDMVRIHLTLDDTGGVFRSYPLRFDDIVAEDETRLDVKYYDPQTLQLVSDLQQLGAVALKDAVVEPVCRGKSPAKAEYNVDESSEIIVVKAGNVGQVGLVGNFDTIEESVFERLKEAQIKLGDLLLASTGEGTLGKATVYDRNEQAIADGHVTIIRLARSLSPDYVAWYLRSDYGRRQISRLFTGSTGLIELTEDAVERILVLAPGSIRQQNQIARAWHHQIAKAEEMEAAAQAKRATARVQFISDLLALVPGSSSPHLALLNDIPTS